MAARWCAAAAVGDDQAETCRWSGVGEAASRASRSSAGGQPGDHHYQPGLIASLPTGPHLCLGRVESREEPLPPGTYVDEKTSRGERRERCEGTAETGGIVGDHPDGAWWAAAEDAKQQTLEKSGDPRVPHWGIDREMTVPQERNLESDRYPWCGLNRPDPPGCASGSGVEVGGVEVGWLGGVEVGGVEVGWLGGGRRG
jgi:hypothetical protein